MSVATVEPSTPPAAGAAQRILIVEDEAVIAMDMAQQLRGFGYEVVGIAANAERARQLAEQTQPDLVMMDIVIKGPQDGIEAARAIRRERDVPVVFLTAYGDTATVERAKSAAPMGYLMKPFRPNELRTTIEVVLNKHALERKLRESEHWLTRTLQCIGDGVLATDPRGAVRFLNPVAEALLGVPADEVRGRPADDVFQMYDDHSRKPVPNPLAAALAGDGKTQPARRGLLLDHAGAPTLYVDAGAASISGDDGRLLGAVLVFRDVTRQRLDEQELERYRLHLELLVRERTASLAAAKAEAERSNRAKTQFLSSMSHELRTPMNAVLGFSDLLADEPLTAGQHVFVKSIHDAGRHLLRLIDDLLDITKAGAGRMHVEQQVVPLAAVLQQAHKMLRVQAEDAQVTLDVAGVPADLAVSADPTRLTQVLVNLIGNAVKYNRPGGWVSVTWALSGEDRVRLSVGDSGIGIPIEQQPRLFQPFERLGAERSGIGGVGLGLALCKQMVELMNGELGFTTEPGIGTTFWVELARAPTDGTSD